MAESSKPRKKLSFGKIEFHDLQNIVQIEERLDQSVFDDWFQFDYVLTQDEDAYLQTLIAENWRYVDSYSEEELKAQIIIPLINKVNFFQNGIRGWYERPLKSIVNDVLFQIIWSPVGLKHPPIPTFLFRNIRRSWATVTQKTRCWPKCWLLWT